MEAEQKENTVNNNFKRDKTKKTKKFCSNIGGQAVLEGVMMRGSKSKAIAVRSPDGTIVVESSRHKSVKEKNIIFRIPVIRGVINFFLSLFTGISDMMRSAEVYGADIQEEPSKFEKFVSKKLKISATTLITIISVLLGLAIAIALFVILPNYLTSLLFEIDALYHAHAIYKNLCEGVIRMIIFIVYIVSISFMKDIKRTFMYHGAEHKTISCYEHNLELTVENAQKMSTVHDRCGTTFTFIVLVISILLFSLIAGWQESLWLRVIIRLALLPLVAGISYEILKFLAKFDNLFVRILKAPGLWLQKLTTKQPTDEMVEVAIKAFKTVLELDENPQIKTTNFSDPVEYSKSREMIKELVKEDSDTDWIFCEVTGLKRQELSTLLTVTLIQHNRAYFMAKEKASGKPLQYILGYTEFYGYRINVDESVLIPRPETELAVEKALNICKDINAKSLLDLCTGSGAAAIAFKKQLPDLNVTASDISSKAIKKARKNAKLNGAEIKFKKSDMFKKLKGKKFDIIFCNPPYIKSDDINALQEEVKKEPLKALDGGADGLDYYRILAQNSDEFLTDKGILVLEIGAGQSEDIISLFGKKYKNIEFSEDYSGILRIAVLKRG